MSTLKAVFIATCVAAVGAACASTTKASPQPRTTKPSTTSSTSTPVASGIATAHIQVPAFIRSGSTVTATLVVDNPGEQFDAFVRNPVVHCAPRWTIALVSGTIPADPILSTTCQHQGLVFHPGENRLAVKLIARYPRCNRPRFPRCVGTPPEPPPLPRGRYRAVLAGDLPWLPNARPVQVEIT
jgi:hypothetical protein